MTLLECVAGPAARASILHPAAAEPSYGFLDPQHVVGRLRALVVLIAAGLALTIGILHLANRQEYRIVEGSAPLSTPSTRWTTTSLTIMSRGARLSRSRSRRSFMQQYDDAVRDFRSPPPTPRSSPPIRATCRRIAAMRKHFNEIQSAHATARSTPPAKAATATRNEFMLEASRIRRSAPDFAGDDGRRASHATNSRELQRITGMRAGLTLLMVIVSAIIIILRRVPDLAHPAVAARLDRAAGAAHRNDDRRHVGRRHARRCRGEDGLLNPAGEEFAGTIRDRRPDLQACRGRMAC